MDQESFSTKIADRIVTLRTAADVVKFSFIVQPSASYLDLQLCGNSQTSHYCGSLSDRCVGKRFRSFVNTDERCRKFLVPSRKLLYTLHLDVPEGREHYLKHDPKFECSTLSNSWHVAKIRLHGELPGDILSNLIKAAIHMNVPKLKMLKMIADLPYSEFHAFSQLSIPVANEFLECFYPRIPDSALFLDFVFYFDIQGWIRKFECPEKLDYLLYCARHVGNELLECCEPQLVSQCLRAGHFKNMGPVLKYVPAAATVKEDSGYYLSPIMQRIPGMPNCLSESTGVTILSGARGKLCG